MTHELPSLSRSQLEVLCRRIHDAAERMSDDQILCVADSLHDALRERRRLRGKVQHKLEERLCQENGPVFPF